MWFKKTLELFFNDLFNVILPEYFWHSLGMPYASSLRNLAQRKDQNIWSQKTKVWGTIFSHGTWL